MFENHRNLVDGPLAIRSFPEGDGVVVVLVGELDRSNVASAALVIEGLLGTGKDPVTVDLQELDFLDSSGIALLSRLNAEERSRGRLRVVSSRAPGVTRILSVTGLDRRLALATPPGRDQEVALAERG